ncbi:MAG: hypothetical protein WD607_01990 [Candidatus Paceibacterota bacterium]
MSEEQNQKNQDPDLIAEKFREKLNEINNYHQNYLDVKQEIENKIESIRSVHGSSQQLKGKIEQVNKEIDDLFEKSKSIVDKLQEKKHDLDGLYQDLENLKSKMKDENNGLEAILIWAQDKRNEIKTKYDDVVNNHSDVEDLRNETEIMASEITEYRNESKVRKDEIEKIYGYMIGEGLSHSFAERKDEIEKSVKFWKWFLVISVVILGLILYWIYTTLLGPEGQFIIDFRLIFSRVLFSSPGIFLVWFSAIQYARERSLLENYSFKAATAKALENYTDLLSARFSEKDFKDSILGFVLSSMMDIYLHPNKDIDRDYEENSSPGGILKKLKSMVYRHRRSISSKESENDKSSKNSTEINNEKK